MDGEKNVWGHDDRPAASSTWKQVGAVEIEFIYLKPRKKMARRHPKMNSSRAVPKVGTVTRHRNMCKK